MAQCIQVGIVSILLHEAKPVLGLFCLRLNTTGWSGHVQECSAKNTTKEDGVAVPFLKKKNSTRLGQLRKSTG